MLLPMQYLGHPDPDSPSAMSRIPDYPKAVRNRHMIFHEAATLGRDAQAKRLWITHFSPALDDPGAFEANARDVFPEAVIGRDGLTIKLLFPEG